MALLVDYSESSDSEGEYVTENVCRDSGLRKTDDELMLSSEDVMSPPETKRKRVDQRSEERESLPLPSAVLQMFKDDMATDDGGHYLGRIRSFPHVRGNWPTYVYIAVELTNEIAACVSEFIKHLEKHLSTSHTFHTLPTLSLHVSLSRTIVIPHHWIEPLTGSLRSKFTTQKSFTMSFGDLAVYTNDEKTRSFIGLTVLPPAHDQLCSLVKLVDESFVDFKLQTFYEDPSFHVSLYWCLGNLLPSVTRVTMATLQHHWDALLINHTADNQTGDHVTCHVTDIRCKTGNKIFTFPFSS